MANDTNTPVRVLVVANRTAATPALLEAVRVRSLAGPARFHLVVPATPRGLHRIADPEDHGRGEAEETLRAALPLLTVAAYEISQAAPSVVQQRTMSRIDRIPTTSDPSSTTT